LIGDDSAPTHHPRIMTAMEHALPWDALDISLKTLEIHCEAGDLPAIKALLLKLPIGYAPVDDDLSDLIWSVRTDAIAQSKVEIGRASREGVGALAAPRA
jgi:hypothetical protein